jgi:PIN domain nuclease of toxin-antitoxin system
MKVLLDTHAFLWWLFDDSRLTSRVKELLEDPKHEIFVSAASSWEIATKVRIGRLPEAAELARDIPGWIARAGFFELPIGAHHAQQAGSWIQDHRDPFDRMLAAQSQIEDLPLVTIDPALKAFEIELIW